MKYLLILIGLSVSGCSEVVGTMKLTTGNPIYLKDRKGKEFEIKDGSMSFKPKWGPVRGRRIVIEQFGRKYQIKRPRYYPKKKSTDFELYGKEMGQDVDVKGQVSFEDLGQHVKQEYGSCTAPGYCCPNGHYNCEGWNMRYRNACWGNRRVRNTYHVQRKIWKAGFYEEGTTFTKLLGTFQSNGEEHYRLIKTKALSPCILGG